MMEPLNLDTLGRLCARIERARRDGDPWSGHMALPGGRRDAGDDRLLETARRETLEEIGVALAFDSLLGELDDLFPNITVLPKVVVRPFVFGLDRRPAVAASGEVAGHLWSSLDTLVAKRQKTHVQTAEGRRRVDAFVLGERIVWGITHRIVSALLDLAS